MTTAEERAAFDLAHAAGLDPSGIERLRGGYANAVFVLQCRDGSRVVARVARGRATAWVAVEAAVMARVAAVTDVPDVLFADPGGELSGRPGMVLSWVTGTSGSRALRGASDDGRRSIARACARTLTRVASIDLGSPGALLDATLTPRDLGGDDVLMRYARSMRRSGDESDIDALARSRWDAFAANNVALAGEIAGEGRLVHADASPSNFLLVPQDGGWRVEGLIDWEFSFSGSRFFDLASLIRGRRGDAAFMSGVTEGLRDEGVDLSNDWPQAAAALDELQMWELLRPARVAISTVGVRAIRSAMRRGLLR